MLIGGGVAEAIWQHITLYNKHYVYLHDADITIALVRTMQT